MLKTLYPSLSACLLLLCGALPAWGTALDVTPTRVEHLVLSDDGLAAVTEVVPLAGRSEVDVHFDEQAVDGSLNFSGYPVVSVAQGLRSVAVEAPAGIGLDMGSLQKEFAGQSVTLYFNKLQEPPLKGRLVDWDYSLVEGERDAFVLQEGKNIRYVDPDAVNMLQFVALSAERPFVRKQPVLHVRLADKAPVQSELSLHYLTRAIRSKMRYALTLLDGSRISLQPYVICENHWRDLDLVEMEYLFGDPLLGTADESSGQEPVQALWLGAHSVKYGQTLQVPLESREAMVEWVFHARLPARHEAMSQAAEDTGERTGLFNALRFANPFGYPLAEAVVNVRESGRFRAMTFMPSTFPGEAALVDIEPANTVSISEQETLSQHSGEKGTPVRVVAEASFTVVNPRNMPARFIVERTLPGDVLAADGEPLMKKTAASADELNTMQHVQWDVSLGVNEQITYNYRYQFYTQP